MIKAKVHILSQFKVLSQEGDGICKGKGHVILSFKILLSILYIMKN